MEVTTSTRSGQKGESTGTRDDSGLDDGTKPNVTDEVGLSSN